MARIPRMMKHGNSKNYILHNIREPVGLALTTPTPTDPWKILLAQPALLAAVPSYSLTVCVGENISAITCNIF